MHLNDIKITLSKRKTIALHVHEDGNVELRAPVGIDRFILEEMVSEKSAWIKQKKASLSERQNSINRKQINWLTGDEIPFSDGFLILQHQFAIVEKAYEDSGKLMIHSPSTEPVKLRQLYFDWLKEMAQQYFPERVEFWQQQMYPQQNHSPKISSRKMYSRWGSCSKNKSLRLNTLLLMLPESLSDYVIVHELCHWQVFNHSAKFYQLMESVLPHWKSLEKQLRNHQYLLLEARK